ncbi:cytochrome P450 [Metarhizium album ARSEF 1941]|uniref:Cytochrome P450 n=1 Tax=Metarhizium album (strain ARSEF 1941) TaxID=1081103 RepID=A0A0B2X493_METAS|nr:cytochrome P450 [Metarhizium album ARSEF 1941]KHO00578.1 cytochrome P450 [Metarhizium album ARSEF 1941]
MQRVLAEYDIYTSSIHGRPAFVKSDMLDMGEKYEGLASERDVEKHRAARKQLAPAFSPRALREYQPRIHHHVNQLLLKLEEIPAKDDGFNIVPACIPTSQLEETSAACKLIDDAQWFERVTTDLGGAIAVNHDFNNVRDGKNHPILESILGVGQWTTIRVVFRRFPLISWMSYLLLSPKVALSYARAHSLSSNLIQDRVKNRHDQKQLDYLTQFMSEIDPLPPKEFLVSQAGHLIFDHFESSSVLSAIFYFLTTNNEAMARLQSELRGTFASVDEMTDEALRELPWLHAILEESLRIHTNVPYGLPRISPGHTIDGNYVPEGCVVSTCAYATTHSVRYFKDPYKFKPQRWLPTTHPDYHHSCDTDARSAFRPFSIGSRNCIGQAMAYVVLRIMVAKLCWKFDWELVNRNDVDWDRDLRVYMVWQKPPVRVRLASFAGQAQ